MTFQGFIQATKSLSTDLVAVPGTQRYDDLGASYYSGLNRDLKPACFVTPSTAAQLSDAVKLLKSVAPAASVAICGHGQQATPGVNSVRNGITIHLGNLKGVKVDSTMKIVSVSAGETMGHVYEEAAAHGLAVVGNRHSKGGIGGDAVQSMHLRSIRQYVRVYRILTM